MWRTDMRASMAGEITTVLRTHQRLKNWGRVFFGNTPVISGGYVGELGDVVVDSIVKPTEVIGIADGKGSILYEKENEYQRQILEVEMEILRRKISF